LSSPERSAAECIPQGAASTRRNEHRPHLSDGLPYQPWAAALVATRTATAQGRSARALPAAELPACVLVPAILQDPDDAAGDRDPARVQRDLSADLHRRRALPVDPNPYWQGYRRGTGRATHSWSRRSGSATTCGSTYPAARSPAAHVTERFKRVDYGHLQIELTVNDPKAYTRPWTVTLTKAIVLDTDLVEEICLENEQDTRLFGAK
jgi:hypothetical protein